MRLFVLAELLDRRRQSGKAGAIGEHLGECDGRGAIRQEYEHLFPAHDEVLGRGKHELVPLLGPAVGEGLRALVTRVVLAVAERALAEHALPQIDGSSRVDEEPRAEPARQRLRASKDGRQPDDARPRLGNPHLREEQLEGRAARLVGDELELVDDHEADRLHELRSRDEEGLRLLEDDDRDLELAPIDRVVELAAVA